MAGTPDTVLPKIRQVLEELRPGHLFIWDGDGAMTHEDSMRSLRLWKETLPALHEMAKELDLPSSFEVSTSSGKRITPQAVTA